MNVLIACEFSGIVRDAFAALGHDAWSCDLLPTERTGQHLVGDVVPIMEDNRWDLVIAHPPCTYLTYAGTAHWNKPGREAKRIEAMAFFMACYHANSARVCVENPFGWPCQQFRPADQIINPFDFGEPIRKRTCLWLRGLSPIAVGGELFAVADCPDPLPPPEPIYTHARPSGRIHKMYGHHENPRRAWHHIEAMGGKGLDRAHERSRSFKSIAEAMARQWG